MGEKIFPLNLTAKAAIVVAGNPVTTRLESGVSNCFPGLEFDHRNLDRRFFPGLIIEFVSSVDPLRTGGRLVNVDLSDPDLVPGTFAERPEEGPAPAMQSRLAAAFNGNEGDALSHGAWFLESIAQGGKAISLHQNAPGHPPLDGMTVWRLVRSLESGPVRIVLARRQQRDGERIPQPRTVTLSGWRRRFVSTSTGTLSEAYMPGELTQSLCSPWMHDFRDCACTYWASNHPDIVLSEEIPGAPADPVADNTPIDWLRANRSPEMTSAALGTEDQNRPSQMDHYQINQRWQDLSIVLGGHEISGTFSALPVELANPFDSSDDLARELVSLAQLEHAVALEYLYAMYSVKNPDGVRDRQLKDVLTFVRHEMLMIAVSEMRHLRWANQLIWELEHANFTTQTFGPSLGVTQSVPAQPEPRPPSLNNLDPKTLQSFIDIERPSGTLDGRYARVLATLRQPKYSATSLEQLAARILADGMQHYSSFREIAVVLTPFMNSDPPAYLRSLVTAPPSLPSAKKALDLYREIINELEQAYALGDMEDAHLIATARQTMFDLNTAAEQLAAAGQGVPFLSI